MAFDANDAATRQDIASMAWGSKGARDAGSRRRRVERSRRRVPQQRLLEREDERVGLLGLVRVLDVARRAVAVAARSGS